MRLCTKLTAWEEVACRDVTQGPDPGPGEPRAGLGRAGASAAEGRGDGGGGVWTSCWAGLQGWILPRLLLGRGKSSLPTPVAAHGQVLTSYCLNRWWHWGAGRNNLSTWHGWAHATRTSAMTTQNRPSPDSLNPPSGPSPITSSQLRGILDRPCLSGLACLFS